MSKYFYLLIMFLTLLWLQNAFAANSPPVLDAIATPQSIVLANTLTFTITATDPDGDQLSFRIENAPSGASINSSSGAFSWKPSKAGSYSATAVVTDNGSPSQNDKQTFNITINPAKCPTQSQIPNAECDALVAIYNETGGPNWRNIYNWTKTNTPCNWEGVGCSGGRVTSLYLDNKNLTGILPDLSALTALESINLKSNQLTQIPDVSNLTALKSLELYNNQITVVPDFSDLTALSSLDLGSNQLTQVPDLSSLTSLSSLDLGYNQLTQVPDLSSLTSLSSLSLGGNPLTQVPDFISSLTSLSSLNLDYNQLTQVPDFISSLTSLSYLNLGGNQLTQVPDLSNLTYLKSLYLYENKLTQVPDLSSLTSLSSLSLGGNPLTQVPDFISSLTSLSRLDLGSNQLTQVPDLSNLTSLKSLYLSGNQLTQVPDLSSLTSLKSLYLSSNQLTQVPDLSSLTSLEYLYLSSNQLTQVPDLNNLTSLYYLNLGYNQLTQVPDLNNLTSLQHFYLQNNQLSGDIPNSLASLTNLSSLDLGYNKLTASDDNLIEFLKSKDSDWANTQTVPPSNITTTAVDADTIRISWTTIPFNYYSGYYQVKYSTTSGGPYTAASTNTGNKYANSYNVNGLEAKTKYYFVIETYTAAHGSQQNALTSSFSAEVNATTPEKTADLQIIQSDSSDPVNIENQITYTLTVKNAGPNEAINVSLVDTLPSGITFISASGTGWTCNESSGTVTCTLNSLAVTSANPITIKATAPSTTGEISNQVEISSDTLDPDASNNSVTETTTIVTNYEPINTISTTNQTINEDSTLIFSTENSNQISITDSDAGTNPVKLKLTTTNGTLTLSGTTGLTFTIGIGTNDAEMVFTGTVTDINTALEDMIFTPIAEFYGNATIQIEVNDQSLTDTDTINITINPVNDIPSFTKGADQTVFVTGRQTIENWATKISAGPSNESSQTLIFTVTNNKNSLFAVQPAIDSTGNLSFTPTAAGSAVVTVVLNDGIDTSAAQTFNIKVNPLPASAPIQQTTSEPTGSSVGTNINCIIKNEGTITDAKIEPGCSIEGGTLEGEIKNEGTIKNVTLAAGTKIKGGQIQGKISGNPEAPAILQHLIIEPQTHTHNVIISDGVELSTDVSLSSGVRFTTTENIPDGIDLTQTLPNIKSNILEVEQPSPLDLSHDPIVNGIGLLPKINQLSMIATNIQQNNNTGFLTLKIETTFFAVIPMKVRYVKTKTRASTEQPIRLGIGQRIYFTTEDGMEIMANPAVQDLRLLKTALAKLNLPTFKITEEANIKVPATETVWYSARPDLASTTVDKDTPNGFIIKEDNNVALIFKDEKGDKREQIFYPCPADMSALGKFELTPKGILEFEIDGQKFKGRLDYQVKQGKATSEAVKVTEIPDSNDVMITYPNGTEQRLFALPE